MRLMRGDDYCFMSRPILSRAPETHFTTRQCKRDLDCVMGMEIGRFFGIPDPDTAPAP
jgi:hypothetical protein